MENKTMLKVLAGITCCLMLMSAATVIYFRAKSANDYEGSLGQFTEMQSGRADTPSSSSTSASQYTITPIQPRNSSKSGNVIQDPAVSKPGENLPPRDVVETTDENGNVVQTPNWDAQKELKPGTDLGDESSKPEYIHIPDSSSSTPSGGNNNSSSSSTPGSSTPAGSGSNPNSSSSTPSSSTPSSSTPSTSPSSPKNGDIATINGKEYKYVSGFGWVERGKGVVSHEVDAPTTGNKVGY